ncbi:MAG: hypothetical protein LBL58_00045, partial [Tannerellaceae bacterium]|nr:hypothetical protein [Tannerellaceae bacterium]
MSIFAPAFERFECNKEEFFERFTYNKRSSTRGIALGSLYINVLVYICFRGSIKKRYTYYEVYLLKIDYLYRQKRCNYDKSVILSAGKKKKQ